MLKLVSVKQKGYSTFKNDDGPGAGEFQGFNPDQIRLFREAFAIFDANRTGCITSTDLTAVMRNLGQNPSESDIEDMVNEIDADGNATIEFDEFLNMMEQKMRSVIPDDTLVEAFNVFDKDGNGFISLDELRHVMSCLGVVLTKTEVEQMMREADTDKDGKLNFKEFSAMMN